MTSHRDRLEHFALESPDIALGLQQLLIYAHLRGLLPRDFDAQPVNEYYLVSMWYEDLNVNPEELRDRAQHLARRVIEGEW